MRPSFSSAKIKEYIALSVLYAVIGVVVELLFGLLGISDLSARALTGSAVSGIIIGLFVTWLSKIQKR